MQAFAVFTALAASLSLHAQPAKYVIYSADSAPAALVTSLLGVHHSLYYICVRFGWHSNP
jgi:hypothetical protein